MSNAKADGTHLHNATPGQPERKESGLNSFLDGGASWRPRVGPRKPGRLSINVQTDSDLNFAPGVLWTAAHYRIPMLIVMHNNRGYHVEVMFVERQCNLHNRGAENAHIGTKLTDPDINYAKMAQAYGLYGEGPITDPKDLAAAYKRGLERVKNAERGIYAPGAVLVALTRCCSLWNGSIRISAIRRNRAQSRQQVVQT